MFGYQNNIKSNNPHYSSNKSSGGYTLIELVITIGVFTLGIMGVLGLSVSNYNDSQDNVDRVIAINLAREGIELVKNVRDSNWLKMDANDTCDASTCTWDYGFDSTSDYMVMSYDDILPTFLTDCNFTIEECVEDYITNAEGVALYTNTFGNYDHDNTGTPTKFSRVIKVERICFREEPLVLEGGDPASFEYYEDLGEAMTCRANPNDINAGLSLISHVQWEDNGIKTVEISSVIYDWKKQ